MELAVKSSPEIKDYLLNLHNSTESIYKIANEAKAKGLDPEKAVPIHLATTIGEKVEGLMSSVIPELVGSGLAARLKELEKEYGAGDWRVSLKIAEEIADGKFCKFNSVEDEILNGVRTGLAYITQGIVSAPIEGIIGVKLKKRRDGKLYLAIYYGGPIRGAGGTGQSVSVLLADHLRKKRGVDAYDPTEDEIKRFFTEVTDYYERMERKQYKPTEKEMDFLIKNIPVELSGDPSTELEVSNYKNLDRIETNRIRSGVALLLTDGLPLKAGKLWKQISKWGKDFNLEWSWLNKYIKLKTKLHDKEVKEEEQKLTPNYYFLSEIVAGRPVFSYPLHPNGFRARYGRSRLTGDGAWGTHPATMRILRDYIATGTQLRVERPGKSTAITPCDNIEGPIIKLKDGSIKQINTIADAEEVAENIEEILFLGDLLISHGDFSEQGEKLAPAGYCEEYWALELNEKIKERGIEKISKETNIPPETLTTLIKNPIDSKISAKDAITISTKVGIPLHPAYTYRWRVITKESFERVLTYLKVLNTQILPIKEEKKILEDIGLTHTVKNNEIIISKDDSEILQYIRDNIKTVKGENGLECLQSLPIKIKDKIGLTIGARMGRPEKARIRKLKGTPHVLFPVGKEGGRLRSFQSACMVGTIEGEFPIFECPACDNVTIYPYCEKCGKATESWRICPVCKKKTRKTKCHKETIPYEKKRINIDHHIETSKKRLGIDTLPELIKGVRGTSNKNHTPENLAKGILRARNNVYVNKDGTIRFDMTELPMTHFKPKEVNLSLTKAKELGYDKDIHGKDLNDLNQVLELKPQDLVLPEKGGSTLFKVSKFIDEELKRFYKLNNFYNLKHPTDLIGHLLIGIAPHTSAGIVGRVVGFSKSHTILAHPYWHDAQRRDCDGEETSIILAMDAFLNFSREFLPAKRGGTMDAPLVVSTILNPEEIDDEVYDVDTCWDYPLEFYKAAEEYKEPWSVKIEQIRNRVGKPQQYEGMGYTHKITDINEGVVSSSYKTIPTMIEKMEVQMELANKIRAVDSSGVAGLVIEGHFIRDIKGNLRKFTQQEFRCVKCNTKYRRPPLSGICTACGGKLIFTISEGTLKKYLEPSLKLANDENVPNYIKQTLELVKNRIETIFGKEKTKQIDLSKF